MSELHRQIAEAIERRLPGADDEHVTVAELQNEFPGAQLGDIMTGLAIAKGWAGTRIGADLVERKSEPTR